MIFVRKSEKARRVCAAVLAAVFLTLTVFMASLPPDKFFTGLSSQNRVDGIIRAFAIIDGTSCADDASKLASRSLISRALFGPGHCADISFISRADSYIDRLPAHDFSAPATQHTSGTDTVARE